MSESESGPHHPRPSCCQAINSAIGSYSLTLPQIVAAANAAARELITDDTLAARTAIFGSLALDVQSAFVASLKKLAGLECSDQCCESAAFAIRDSALGTTELLAEVIFNPVIPLVPGPLGPTFIVSAFTNAIMAGFQEQLELTESTITCQNEPPCPDVICLPCKPKPCDDHKPRAYKPLKGGFYDRSLQATDVETPKKPSRSGCRSCGRARS